MRGPLVAAWEAAERWAKHLLATHGFLVKALPQLQSHFDDGATMALLDKIGQTIVELQAFCAKARRSKILARLESWAQRFFEEGIGIYLKKGWEAEAGKIVEWAEWYTESAARVSQRSWKELAASSFFKLG